MSEILGITFTGGGGKGAYQIGVWKALSELGLAQFVSTVAGTSVGGLNTALFLEGSVDMAEDIWSNISQEDILSSLNNPELLINLITNFPYALPLTISSFINEGIFSNEGLEKLIDSKINLEMVSNSSVAGYVTCCCKDEGSHVRYVRLNGLETGLIKKLLLATSAIPFLFPSVEIDNTDYIDGGSHRFIFGHSDKEGCGCIPLLPLIETGCTIAIVVHLSAATIIRKEDFPNLKIIEIFPSKRLGGLFTGMLDFSAEGARRRIELGYQDTKAIFEPWIETLRNMEGIAKSFKGIVDNSDFREIKEKMINGEQIRESYRKKNNKTK